ncbi:aldo/keto reductase [Litorilituus sediminis]|uniref:Aldo/keto reductase n=1 Tax=Litorilituus sediminis TaxID=718192 RepID=A0A4V0ZFW4_9GAMM|nr:aldo/keto reductase [Litorilituus sediminis]QBG35210.1 aldo/keto reductase [Litorilituus sediminis]
MKLALGTVQFGLNYGISNQHGQISKAQVKDILTHAKQLGIKTLDSAAAYGNSEQVIGELTDVQDFDIITKVPALTTEQTSIMPYVKQSLDQLQKPRLSALLFHQADNLISHPDKAELYQQLIEVKTQGLTKRIGVSLYSPSQLTQISKQFAIDIAQVPINVFDQRFLSPQCIKLCKQKQIRLHARSLFLQGLIFFDADSLPAYFSPFKEKIIAFKQLAKQLSCSKLTLALAIVAQDSHNYFDVIEQLVVGVCSVKQLDEIVQAYQQAQALKSSIDELATLQDERLAFINPSMWPAKAN